MTGIPRRQVRPYAPAALFALIALLVSSANARATAPRDTPVRGGQISIAFTEDVVTFDAAQAYSDDWVVMNGTLYNGLYQFDRNGKPQLDLAAAPPRVSADRKTWTFKLRQGVRFSNGMEMTADDLKYSIMRALDPHLKPAPSWGQTTDTIFKGAQDFIDGKSKDVSGIQVLDKYTIRFTLNQPVAIFPYIMAETFNMVVPKAVVSKESADYFASHPVGTGPFMLQSWQKGVKVVFVRNPYYFRKGKPYLDKVTVYVNVAANVIALKVEKGELTGFGVANELSPADLQLAEQDPKLKRFLVPAPTVIVTWLDQNTHDPLLKSLAFRQAVAMAINRPHLVKLLGGLGIPANQLYIPLDPQYDKSLDAAPIYPYNPTKAAALLKQSGYHGQPVQFLYSNNQVFDADMAPGIEQDLKAIGLNATVRGVAHTSLLATTQALTGHQLSTAFWGIDFPDGYDIYSGEMACNANTVGGSAAHYCDPQADNIVNRAEALNLGKDRDTLLQQAQIRILRSASKVPLVFLKNVEMVSPNLGGYYYHPTFSWQFENYWLKH